MQGLESEVEDSIRESCQLLQESLDSVVRLAGQLYLVWKVQDKSISFKTSSGFTLNTSDDFLSLSVSLSNSSK